MMLQRTLLSRAFARVVHHCDGRVSVRENSESNLYIGNTQVSSVGIVPVTESYYFATFLCRSFVKSHNCISVISRGTTLT